MNSIAGKSTGIALLMAAALIAALFAMGVFSATGVGATTDDHTETHAAVLTTLTIANAAVNTEVVLAGPPTAGTFSYTTDAVGREVGQLYLNIEAEPGTKVTKIEGAPDFAIYDGAQLDSDDPLDEVAVVDAGVATQGPLHVAIPLVSTFPKEIKITVADHNTGTEDDPDDDSHSTSVYTIKVIHENPASSDTAGEAVTLNLRVVDANAAADDALRAAAGDEITIEFGRGFDLPTSIDPDEISINGLKADDARISGQKVIVSWDDFTTDEMTENLPNTAGTDRIRIRAGAGITNPTTAGLYEIKISGDSDTTENGTGAINVVTVVRKVTVKPEVAKRGADITITGTGFGGGTATVFIDKPGHTDDSEDPDKSDITKDATNTYKLDDDSQLMPTGDPDNDGDEDDTPTMYGENYDSDQDVQLGIATITDGAFKLTTPVDDRFGKDALGLIRINANDGSGMQALAPMYTSGEPTDSDDATLSINSSISASPEDVPLAKELTITVKDWPDSDAKITEVTIGGGEDALAINVDVADDGSATVKVTVPSDTNTGTQKLVVKDNMDNSQSIDIVVMALALTIDPASAVNRQQITIQGTGFGDREDIVSIDIGSVPVGVPSDERSSSSGDVVITFPVPEEVDADKTHKVKVVDESGRTGIGDLIVPKPAITLDPTTSRRGTDVTVEGTGFPANDLVLISYPEGTTDRTVGTGQTDTTGSFTAVFKVPSFAKIGASSKVKATSSVNEEDRSASNDHSLPSSMLISEPNKAVSGSNITIRGENLPVFASITELKIGQVEVTPSPAPSTGVNGAFETIVLVPQLELGNQQLSVMVGTRAVTSFIEIVEAGEEGPQAPADVFASLGDRLVRVWYLERSTQVWSFYDPDSDVAAFNTLTEVSSGQNVSIIISPGANIEFQDMTLYPGTNPIALD